MYRIYDYYTNKQVEGTEDCRTKKQALKYKDDILKNLSDSGMLHNKLLIVKKTRYHRIEQDLEIISKRLSFIEDDISKILNSMHNNNIYINKKIK